MEVLREDLPEPAVDSDRSVRIPLPAIVSFSVEHYYLIHENHILFFLVIAF